MLSDACKAVILAARRVVGRSSRSGMRSRFADQRLPEAELHDLRERIESRKGLRQLSYMKELRMGNDQYELIRI